MPPRTRSSLFLSFAIALLLCTGPVVHAEGSVKTVSRGVFLRVMVKALDLDTPSCTLPYRRVPASMKGVLCAANEKKALSLWPSDQSLLLSKPITRGEALLVLTSLTDASETADVSAFRDVRTPQEKKAAMNAISRAWLQPKRSTYFGFSSPLTTEEAALLAVVISSGVASPSTPEGAEVLPNRKLLDTIWQILDRDYLYRNTIDTRKLTEDTADALVKSLNDPYTRYFRPDDAQQWREEINGVIRGGIGANVEIFDGRVRVVSPLPGSPAELAGLRPGDIISEANGASLAGMTLEKAVSLIRGEAGTPVTLTIVRSSETLRVAITRQVITVPDIIVTSVQGVPVVRLLQFGEYADREIESVFKTIAAQNPRGVVLDLRNDPGGLLMTAVKVAGVFLPINSTVTIVKGKSETTEYTTQKAPILSPQTNVAVLVNNGSASASEIVAAALKDAKRGTLVGTRTFGKGTVQEVLDFVTGDALKLTIAEFFSPLGATINKTGVEPDIAVEAGPFQAGAAYGVQDPQLQRAIDLVR